MLIVISLWSFVILSVQGKDALHPLDTITPDEVYLTANLVRSTAQQKVPSGRFIISSILLKEPKKAELLPFFLRDEAPGPGEICRRSHTVLFDLNNGGDVYEVVVDLDKGKVDSWTQMPRELHLQPMTAINEEGEIIPQMALSDLKVQERFKQLGVKNITAEVSSDPWFYIYNDENPAYKNRRIAQVWFYLRNFEQDNFYAHPVNFIAIVDVQLEKVVEIQDLPVYHGTNRTLLGRPLSSRAEHQYDPLLRPWESYRPRVKPVHVFQPEGVNFRVSGSQIQWQGFKLRVAFSAREGLVLNTVSFTDKGKYHPLFYKLTLSELNLIYADPRPPFHRNIPIDLGHYGLGIRANELSSPEDCRGITHFFHGVGNYHNGLPKTKKNAVCVFEDDGGVLWRKGKPHSGRIVTVRANRLAIMSIITSGNYDYMFTWYFHQDASIRLEVKLNGVVNPKVAVGVPKLSDLRHGTVIAPNLNTIYHQHIFTYRIDADVGGVKNTVHTVDILQDDAPTGSFDNPFGNGWTTKTTELQTASVGRSNTSPEQGRTWLIAVPDKLHPISGTRMGYKLHPDNTMSTLLRKDSPLHPLCAFSDYDVWVTKYNDEQMYPGGFYLNNSGLPEWVGNAPDESIEREDVVVWHTFRTTHIPRTEEFPLMPAESFGFWLKPANYFMENPAMNIPPIVTYS